MNLWAPCVICENAEKCGYPAGCPHAKLHKWYPSCEVECATKAPMSRCMTPLAVKEDLFEI
jgi:hypothetical protein